MHTPKLIFLFIFLSVLNSTADIKPRIDGWSLVHFFGGVAVCNIMGSDIRAVVVTTWLACVWGNIY